MLAGLGLLVVSTGLGQPAAPAPSAPQPARPADGDAVRITITPAPNAQKPGDAKAAKKAAPAKKKEEPPAAIEGLAIERPDGGFLGLKVVNNNFVLTFYDSKKKKIEPDVARAGLRWVVRYQPGPEFAMLNPGGGGLTSTKTVRAPFVFKVFISLYAEGKDEAVESHAVEYHGE